MSELFVCRSRGLVPVIQPPSPLKPSWRQRIAAAVGRLFKYRSSMQRNRIMVDLIQGYITTTSWIATIIWLSIAVN